MSKFLDPKLQDLYINYGHFLLCLFNHFIVSPLYYPKGEQKAGEAGLLASHVELAQKLKILEGGHKLRLQLVTAPSTFLLFE